MRRALPGRKVPVVLRERKARWGHRGRKALKVIPAAHPDPKARWDPQGRKVPKARPARSPNPI